MKLSDPLPLLCLLWCLDGPTWQEVVDCLHAWGLNCSQLECNRECSFTTVVWKCPGGYEMMSVAGKLFVQSNLNSKFILKSQFAQDCLYAICRS